MDATHQLQTSIESGVECLAQSWLDQGQPDQIVLAELGPGRGTLMADILRAGRAVPGFAEAAQVVMLEASAPLRAAQTAAVPGVRHIARLEEIPRAHPLFVIANEML